jgi:hypothetical protein
MRRQYLIAEFLTSANEFVRQVLAQKSVVTLRWNAVSSAYLTLRDDHPIVPTLVSEQGLRCAVWMVVVEGNTLVRELLVEGRVGQLTGSDAPYGTVLVPVLDDWQDFTTMLGWQVPGAGVGGQSAAEYARYTGTSEDNAKAAIAANAARLGRPWDVAPSEGRGDPDTAPLELRMHDLAEKMVAALTNDRLQLTIVRNRLTGRWLVDVVEGETFARPVTPQSGVLLNWSWVQKPPTATRAVVGGRGEGTARAFTLVIDTALEAALGVALEIFVDARNAPEGADLAPYGWEELAKHRGASGLTTQLRETSWFRFPDSYRLGTKLLIQIGALQVEDVVTQIVITHDPGSGFSAVPTVGTATEDPQARLVGFIRNVATAVRGLERT